MNGLVKASFNRRSPFEEVKVVELDGAAKWILWIFSLLCVHIVCHYSRKQQKKNEMVKNHYGAK